MPQRQLGLLSARRDEKSDSTCPKVTDMVIERKVEVDPEVQLEEIPDAEHLPDQEAVQTQRDLEKEHLTEDAAEAEVIVADADFPEASSTLRTRRIQATA